MVPPMRRAPLTVLAAFAVLASTITVVGCGSSSSSSTTTTTTGHHKFKDKPPGY
jgi:hypothetical protein